MSKVKIYDGMTFDMSTGEVLESGKVSYVDSENVALCGGGGKTSTTTSGWAKEYKPEIQEMLDEAKGMYDRGELGQVADFSELQKKLYSEGGVAGQTADRQIALEKAMMDQANKGVDLSGARTRALQDAKTGLGMSDFNAGRSGGLGGARQALNSSAINNNLAATFADVDQRGQAMNFANKQAALGAQGRGATLLGAAGAAQQQQAQNLADAPYKALAQRIGMFSGMAPKESTTTQTGGK